MQLVHNKTANPEKTEIHLFSGYMPTFAEIVEKTGLPKDCLAHDTVTIPTSLFRLLLSYAVAQETFDAAGYGRKNPDVVAAVEAGKTVSLHAHYVFTGWFEGRPLGRYPVNEKWYMDQYPDIARAKRENVVRSAVEHYNNRGRLEGRAANPGELPAIAAWRTALGR